MLQHVTLPRGLVDPLHALWEIIKRKAATMPLLQLATVALFYHSLGRNEEAFEVANIRLQRLDSRDTTLNIMVRCTMGAVSCEIEKYELSIEHFEYSLPKADELLGATRFILFHAKIYLAESYEMCGRYADAIKILKFLIEDRLMSQRVNRKYWIRTQFYLGRNLYFQFHDREALTTLRKYLTIYQKTYGGFTEVESWKIRDAFYFMAHSHFELSEYDEVFQDTQNQQEIAKKFGIFNLSNDVDMKRLRAMSLIENNDALGRS
jgi:tetratricopeptide (TPR) repeat protein